MICQACTAATLVSAGVVAVTGETGDLHASCDYPGSGCTCPCEYAQGSRCTSCGRARHVSQLDDGECTDKSDCARSIVNGFLEGRAAPQAINRRSVQEAALVAAAGPVGRSAFLVSPSNKRKRPCACGCEEQTGGGLYRPGHDARHVSQLTARVKAGELELEDALDAVDSDKLKAKLTKAVEG